MRKIKEPTVMEVMRQLFWSACIFVFFLLGCFSILPGQDLADRGDILDEVKLSYTAQVSYYAPEIGDYSMIISAIMQTMAPQIKIQYWPVAPPSRLILLDDGDDETADDLDVTGLFSFDAEGIAYAAIPEFYPVNTLPGPNQDVFRTLLDDTTTIRIIYYGENRVRVYGDGELCFEAHFLNYESEQETVVGADDGVVAHPDDTTIFLMKNHVILDFDSTATDYLISHALMEFGLRPQGITGDLGVIQARPYADMNVEELLDFIDFLNVAIPSVYGFEEARVDLVATIGDLGGEAYPLAINADFQQPTSDWKEPVRRNQYHHFFIQTFPAHRLIDITKDGSATIRVFSPDSGAGKGQDLSGAPNTGNPIFVRGSRLKQPVLIHARGKVGRRGRTAATDPHPFTNHKSDGDLGAVIDSVGHGTAVLSVLASDGIGDKAGPGLVGDSVVLGTGKDAEVRVVKWLAASGFVFLNNELCYYKQLEIAASDPNVKVYSSSTGWTKPIFANATAIQKGNIKRKYANVAQSGKIILVSGGNETATIAERDRGLIAPDRQFSRSLNVGAEAFKQRVMVVGSSSRVLTPDILEIKSWYSNSGVELSVVAPGDTLLAVSPDSLLTNVFGTSFSTPVVAGIAAELMLVDPTIQQPANLPKVLEYIEATADDIGAAGRDNETGFGRVNFWKAALSAANGGLSKEGRPDADADGKDDFFTFLPLKDASATTWYGLEVRVPIKNAVVWFRDAGNNCVKAQDAGAVRPGIDGAEGSDIVAFFSTQSFKDGAGKILPSLPFSAAELAVAGVEQWYLARFSIEKEDLEGMTHLLVVKPSKIPAGPTEEGPVLISLPIDLEEMRKGPASADEMIKNRVEAFDDFVFHIRTHPAWVDGTREMAYDNHVSLFPNPARGKAYLEFDLPQPENVSVSVVDLMGKNAWFLPEQSVLDQTFDLDLALFPAGVYCVQVQIGNAVLTKKLVLNR